MTSFFVPGRPAAQGSKRAFPRTSACGKISVALVESSKHLKPWRQTINAAAREHGLKRLEGPVGMSLTFVMQRPASHHIAGARDRPLKASAPPYPSGRVGDLDKLTRAVLDALDGVAYYDDSQVCLQSPVAKVYGNDPGVSIDVWAL